MDYCNSYNTDYWWNKLWQLD